VLANADAAISRDVVRMATEIMSLSRTPVGARR